MPNGVVGTACRGRSTLLGRLVVAVGMVAIACANPGQASAQSVAELTGTCGPATILPVEDGSSAITFAGGVPVGATVTSAELAIVFGGVGEDVVAALAGPNETFAGLIAGIAGTSANVAFADRGTTAAATLTPDGAGHVAGLVKPLEPLSAFAGLDPRGAWSVVFLNLNDSVDLGVVSCDLRLTLSIPTAPPAPPSGPIPGVLPATGGSTGPLTGLAVGLLIIGVASVVISRRRRVGHLLVLSLVAGVAVIVAADTQSVRAQVVPDPAGPPPTHPWNQKPDGRIVFAGTWRNFDTDEQASGLFSAPRDCGYEECITRLTNGDDQEPDVSPTGFQVAFIRSVEVEVEPGYFRARDQLAVLDLHDGSVRVLASSEPHDPYFRVFNHPSWSPDEQRIAYGGEDGKIMIIDAGGGPAEAIGGGLDSAPTRCVGGDISKFIRMRPTWSPNGAQIAYIRASELGFIDDSFCGYVQYNRAFISSTSTHNGEQAVAGDIGWIDEIDFSPDGNQLAIGRNGSFVPDKPTDFSGAWLEPVAAGSRVRLSSQWSSPRWSPDGEFLAGVQRRTGAFGDGVLIRPDGTAYQTGCSFSDDTHSWGSECYGDGFGRSGVGIEDPQCAPGSCLAGIMLTANGDGATADAVTASGALTGPVLPYLFAKKQLGSHVVNVAAPGATILEITCDDTNSSVTGSTITYVVEESEIVECVVRTGPLNDEDGDGIDDAIDPCLGDPLNTCLDPVDTDGDGLFDDDDPCPTDPTNTCEPEEKVCSAFAVDLTGDLGGLDWFRFNTSGTACGTWAGNDRTELTGLQRSGEIVLPAATVAIMSLMFTLQYDANANPIKYGDVGEGTDVTGSFELCALPLPPGISKGVGKLVALVSRFGGARLIGKATNLWIKVWGTLVVKTWKSLGGPAGGAEAMETAIKAVDDSLSALFENALGAGLSSNGIFELQLCAPMWDPTVSLTAKPDGSGVFYTVSDIGIPEPRVVIATNATAN